MLEKNEEAWKDKVKFIGASVDDSKETIIKRIEERNWNKIDHYTFGSWDANHHIIKGFNIRGIPFVALLD